MKIGLRFFARGLLDFSADANLPIELDPVKPKRSVRIRRKLFPFCALVIREEHEAVFIKTLQKNYSHRRSAIPPDGGKTHCVHIMDAGLNRGGEPIAKLFNRVAGKIAPAQAFTDMLVT